MFCCRKWQINEDGHFRLAVRRINFPDYFPSNGHKNVNGSWWFPLKLQFLKSTERPGKYRSADLIAVVSSPYSSTGKFLLAIVSKDARHILQYNMANTEIQDSAHAWPNDHSLRTHVTFGIAISEPHAWTWRRRQTEIRATHIELCSKSTLQISGNSNIYFTSTNS